MKKIVKNTNGITLIALVITIVVLLILAAVSIATLTGENGILTRANEAKTETEEAKEDELRRLTALEAATNLENTTHTDTSTGEEKTVTIPAGFAVSQVEGENTIEDGLVIIDSKGNEFVWVPVNQENFDTEFVRRAGYHEGTEQPMTDYGEANAEGINVEIDGTKTGVEESSITVQEVRKMYDSVYQKEGFYIGRYETGKDRNGNVVVQKGADVYTNVPWSKNGTMDEEKETENTQNGAIELTRNFDTANNYTTVTSTLIYGVQWDAVMKWMGGIENESATGSLTKYIQDSKGMGWYNDNSGHEAHQTGIDVDSSNKNNCVKNIYDLAGNVYEWTMESYSTDSRVDRGGSYGLSGLYGPASYRNSNNPSYSSPSIGFRITLYLQS